MDTDVLIAGAGPTGLCLAASLARRGLRARILDREPVPATTSKAMVLHARTLELFEDMGVADALVGRGLPLRGATLWSGGEVIVSAGFEEIDSRYNYALSISQAETEAVLTEHLRGLGVEVERGTELFSFRQDGTGVSAVTRGPKGEARIRAGWLVGTDGAHSTVRKQLEIPFEGSTYEERLLLADVRIAWDSRDDRIATFFGADGLCACFPMKGGRWRVIATAPGDEQAAPTLEQMQAIFDARTAVKGVLSDPGWLARFRIHCRQAARYRDDRVLLAGDAAHVHSPVGGQGLNTGIQDALNLAWKLALVHQGHARGRLLDSYETERHAVGQALLQSTDAVTRVGLVKGTVARHVRSDVARVLASFESVQQKIAREIAELGVGYERSPIVREDRLSILQARLGTVAGGDTPTLSSMRDFEAGPRAGARAPDANVVKAGGGAQRLAQALDGKAHTLLVFDGRAQTAEGYARYVSIAQRLAERWPDRVRTVLVTPRPARPEGLPESLPVLLDPDGEAEKRYAATTECLYLVRPDLYVGYRSQPADEQKLADYLGTILR